MARKKNTVATEGPTPLRFLREDKMIINGFEIVRGETIKVSGQYGLKFKFDYLTTNPDTGATWVDCFELQRGQTGCFRAFKIEDVRRIPKKRKRAKRVV